MSAIPWEAIKAEYIAGDDSVTQRFLADKHHVNFATIGKKASAQGWADARQAYRQQVASKTLSRVSTTEAEMRAKQLRVADVLLSKGLAAFQKLDPTTYAEALRTVETALEQARKAAGIVDGTGAQVGISVTFADEPGQPDD